MKNFSCLQIGNIYFFSDIIELVRELVTSNMHNKSGKDTWKTFKLSRPQGQIIDVKCKKSQ